MPLTKRWLFRVSSHLRHGRGHVARCTVLAEEMREKGYNVFFQLDQESIDAATRLKKKGFTCTEKNFLNDGHWSGCIVDGYELLNDEFKKYVSKASPVVVINDFLEVPQGTSLLINSAFHLKGDKVSDVPALLGPNYALIDPQFVNIARKDYSIEVKKILVSLGRTESPEKIIFVLKLLEEIKKHLDINLVIDSYDPNFKNIYDLTHGWKNKINVISDAPDMFSLLKNTDLVIGTGGVSLIERVAAGVPSLTILGAENQRLTIEGAASMGVTIDGSDMPPNELLKITNKIIENPEVRVSMSDAGRRIVDGMGANRVVGLLDLLLSNK